MSKKRERRKVDDEEEKQLEEGLEETFPASDPPAITEPHHRQPRRPKERDVLSSLAKRYPRSARAVI